MSSKQYFENTFWSNIYTLTLNNTNLKVSYKCLDRTQT